MVILILLLIFANIAVRTFVCSNKVEEFLFWMVFCSFVNPAIVIVFVLLALSVVLVVTLFVIKGLSKDKIKGDMSGESDA